MLGFEWFEYKRESSFDNQKTTDLPVSVVLVVIKSRMNFVHSFVLPSIQANSPAEIIIIDDDDMSNQEKRNKGAAQAKQKYLFICDDDVIMPSNHLRTLYETLEKDASLSFAYSDYQAIVMAPSTHPQGKNYYQGSKEFNVFSLKENNYIDTCSLVKREHFPGFDPAIKRFQDWDLWLTMVHNGHMGKYVKTSGIIKFYLDEGITSNKISAIESRNIVLKKHGLLNWFYSSLFIDTGKGFNKSEVVFAEAMFDNNSFFTLCFDLSAHKNIKRLRFDPVEGKICKVRIDNIVYSDQEEYMLPVSNLQSNGLYIKENSYGFLTSDPQIILNISGNLAHVKITGAIDMNYHPPKTSIYRHSVNKVKQLLHYFRK